MKSAELVAMGSSDEELCDEFVSLTQGERPELGEDDEDGQARRRRVFDSVESHRREPYQITGVAALGSFSNDDPETHGSLKEGDNEDESGSDGEGA